MAIGEGLRGLGAGLSGIGDLFMRYDQLQQQRTRQDELDRLRREAAQREADLFPYKKRLLEAKINRTNYRPGRAPVDPEMAELRKKYLQAQIDKMNYRPEEALTDNTIDVDGIQFDLQQAQKGLPIGGDVSSREKSSKALSDVFNYVKGEKDKYLKSGKKKLLSDLISKSIPVLDFPEEELYNPDLTQGSLGDVYQKGYLGVGQSDLTFDDLNESLAGGIEKISSGELTPDEFAAVIEQNFSHLGIDKDQALKLLNNISGIGR